MGNELKRNSLKLAVALFAALFALSLPCAAPRAAAHESNAWGDNATAERLTSFAIGISAEAYGLSSYAIGSDAKAEGSHSFAIGSNSETHGDDSFAIGNHASASAQFSYAIGYTASTSAANSIALGSYAVADEEWTISVGGYEGNLSGVQNYRIVNMAAGQIYASSGDAINGSQLYSLVDSLGSYWSISDNYLISTNITLNGNEFTSLSAALEYLAQGWDLFVDNGTTVKPGDTVQIVAGNNVEITGPTTSEDSNTHTIELGVTANPEFDTVTVNESVNVAGTVTIDNTGIQVGDNITISAADGSITASSVTADSGKFGELTVAEKVTINDSGIDMGGTDITNAGTIGATNVNISDSLTVADVVTINNSGITMGNYTMSGTSDGFSMGGAHLTGIADGEIYQGSSDAVTGNQLWQAYRRMDDLQEAINIVGAHAAALSGLNPVQYNPYEPTTLSAAVGAYRDEYAVAVGMFHYMRENVMFNMGASLTTDGDFMGRAGVSFRLGSQGGKKKPELARDMVTMQQQFLSLHYVNEELMDEIRALKKQVDELLKR